MVDNVQLLDANGQPIKRAELKGEPQTAKTAHLHREFSDHPSRGLTPSKLSRILEEAERGDLVSQARLAEDMEEKDAHLFAELSKRRRALLGLDWDLQPPKDASQFEKDETARIEEMIRELDFETLIYDSAAAILYGYACLEFNWVRHDGQWQPQSIDYRPADWFMCQPEDRDTLLLRTADGMGAPLRPWGWIVHRHQAKSGYLVRSGLARILAWPYLFRNYSARDLAEFLEIYGLPMRLGKYPAGVSEDEKATLMRAVVNIGHAAAGIIPHGMDIEFQEAAKGASDPFMAMMSWAESSMSKAILGGTLTSQTSDSGGGAYALGQVHNEVRHDILISDAKQIARTLTQQLVMPLVRLNSRMERMPKWVFDTEQPEDLKLFSEALPKLVESGMQIPASWVHEKLRIPKPDGDELVLQMPQAPAPAFARADLRAQVKRAAARTQKPAKQTWEEQAERLGADAEPVVNEWLNRVETLLNEVDSLEEFADKMMLLFPDMDQQQLADIMADAMAAADLAGRDDLPGAANG